MRTCVDKISAWNVCLLKEMSNWLEVKKLICCKCLSCADFGVDSV